MSEPRILIVSDHPETATYKAFASPLAKPFLSTIRHVTGVSPTCRTLVPIHPAHADFSRFLVTNAKAKASKQTPTNTLFPTDKLLRHRKELQTYVCNHHPDFIFAFGPYSMWALSDEGFTPRPRKGYRIAGSTDHWRGSQLKALSAIPILPLHSLAHMKHQPLRSQRTIHDICSRYTAFDNNHWDDTPRDFIINPSVPAVTEYLQNILTYAKTFTLPLACDIETRNNQITCIGFSHTTSQAICIPFIKPDGSSYYSPAEEEHILDLLRLIFSNPSIQIIGQNFLYDAQHLALSFQVKPYISHDTMIYQHLLFPGQPLDLNTLSSIYCTYHRYWKADATDENSLYIYNCRDCVVTLEVYDAQLSMLKYHRQRTLAAYQMRQVNEILTMMIRGVRIDLEEKKRASSELDDAIATVSSELEELLPPSIYTRDPSKSSFYGSPLQLSFIFTKLFGLRPYYDKKLKRYSTNDAALDFFALQEPILRTLTTALQLYRKLLAHRTSVDMLVSSDGRMRSSYTPTVETFRWKSSSDAFGCGGNLQNIPKGGEI